MSSEKKWVVGGAESSDKPDSDQQNQNKGVSQNARWVQPPLPRSEGLLNTLNQRRFVEMPVRPPLPLEKIVDPAEDSKDKDKDDEDKKDKKKDKNAQANEAPAEELEEAGAAAGQMEASPLAELAQEAVRAAETTESVQPSEESEPEEVFETIAPAAEAEFKDIPHVDEDRPTVPLTASENKTFSEMVADLVPTMESRDADRKDVPPIPSWDMPEVGSPFDPGPGEDSRRSRPSPATPFSMPSWGPASAPAAFEAGRYAPPGPESSPSSSTGGEVSSAFTAGLEALKAATNLAELASNPNRLVTRILTQTALEGYFGWRKQERYSNEPLLHRQEEIAQLNEQQRRANERLNALFQQQAEQAAQASGGQEIFDQDGNRIVLQPDWKFVRSAGGYGVVVDRHNRVIHEAVRYGKAFQREQQREQLSDDVFAKLSAGGAVGDAQGDDGFAAPLPPATGQGSQQQTSDRYQLPGQPKTVDVNHRLPEPRNYIKEAALNPWLWTAIAVLFIIYFVASLA